MGAEGGGGDDDMLKYLPVGENDDKCTDLI